jgi:hypothetical protein
MIADLRLLRHRPMALLAISLMLLTNTACSIETTQSPAAQATQNAIGVQAGQAAAAAQTAEAYAITSIAHVESIATTIAASSAQLETAVSRLQPSVAPAATASPIAVTPAPTATTPLSPTESLPVAGGELFPVGGGLRIGYQNAGGAMTYPVDDILVYRDLAEMETEWRNDHRWEAITMTLRLALIPTGQAPSEYKLLSIKDDQPDPGEFPQARPTTWNAFGVFAQFPEDGQIPNIAAATPAPGVTAQSISFRSSLVVEVGDTFSIVTLDPSLPSSGTPIGMVLSSIPNSSKAARLLVHVSGSQPSSLLIVLSQEFPAGGDQRKRWCSQGYRYRLWMCRRLL